MARKNIGALIQVTQIPSPKFLSIETELNTVGQQAEDDIVQAMQDKQDIQRMQQAIDDAEEVIQEAEEEHAALQQTANRGVGLESFQRAVKSFERRTGLIFKANCLGIESISLQNDNMQAVKIATEGIVTYVKKLIRMLIDALNSLWERVKAFFKNLFSGADKLHKRAEKIKEAAGGENKEGYRRKSEIIGSTYYPSTHLKKIVEEGENISIQNALIMELNVLETSSEALRAGLEYAIDKKPEAIEKYEEKAFARGMDNDKNKWDRKYYMMQEVYISTNFAKERYLHMIEVREHLRNKGVKGFVRSNKGASDEPQASAPVRNESSEKTSPDKITVPSVLEFVTIDGKALNGKDFVDQYIKQSTDSHLYRESLDSDIKDFSSGVYVKILEAAKKPDNKEEIVKLIKDTIVEPTSKNSIIEDKKDGLLTYGATKNDYLLGNYYEEYINFKKDATWDQISTGYSKISSGIIYDTNQKKITEVSPLTREEAAMLASAAMAAMENYKKLEDQQKRLDAGFNKILSETKRLENDESIPRDQLIVATGFVRATINATIRMLVAVNSYELRLTKAALDYAAASIRE